MNSTNNNNELMRAQVMLADIEASFKKLAKARDPATALVGTVATTIMGALTAQRYLILPRLFDAESRLAAIEKKLGISND